MKLRNILINLDRRDRSSVGMIIIDQNPDRREQDRSLPTLFVRDSNLYHLTF